jgi:hypothetical protein
MSSSMWLRSLLVSGLCFVSIPGEANISRLLITCEGFPSRSQIERIEIDYQLGETLIYVQNQASMS